MSKHINTLILFIISMIVLTGCSTVKQVRDRETPKAQTTVTRTPVSLIVDYYKYTDQFANNNVNTNGLTFSVLYDNGETSPTLDSGFTLDPPSWPSLTIKKHPVVISYTGEYGSNVTGSFIANVSAELLDRNYYEWTDGNLYAKSNDVWFAYDDYGDLQFSAVTPNEHIRITSSVAAGHTTAGGFGFWDNIWNDATPYDNYEYLEFYVKGTGRLLVTLTDDGSQFWPMPDNKRIVLTSSWQKVRLPLNGTVFSGTYTNEDGSTRSWAWAGIVGGVEFGLFALSDGD